MKRDGIILTTLIFAASALIGRAFLAPGQTLLVPPGVPVVVLGAETSAPQVVQFGTLDGPEDRRFSLAVANPTDRTLRIVGFDRSCTRLGCLCIEGIPAEVPSGGSLILDYRIDRTKQTGRFRAESTLYTDSPAGPKVPFTVEGEILGGRLRSSQSSAGEAR